jgi:hypothetical protein
LSVRHESGPSATVGVSAPVRAEADAEAEAEAEADADAEAEADAGADPVELGVHATTMNVAVMNAMRPRI